MRILYRSLPKLFLFFCLSSTAFGTPNATLAGRIRDANDAPIGGATIEVVNVATNQIVVVRTNDDGFYVAPELAPGIYRVTASQTNFQSAVRERVELNVASNVKANFTLQAGQISESVTVEADSRDLVETDSAAVGTLVDRQFVENLPLNGRSFQSLIELTPGVVLVPSTIQSSGQFSVNGQRSNANYFTVDGVSGNIGTSTNFQFYQQAAGTLPGLSIFGGTNTLASVDAVQEFRVQTSGYEAEYGRQPGGQIEIVTRRGTNDFSLTAFDYIRNDVFDANDFFDNQAGRPRRKLRQNDFGFVAGGPVSSTSKRDIEQNASLVRTDHNFTDTLTANFRFAYAQPTLDTDSAATTGTVTRNYRRWQQGFGQFIYTISPNQILELRGGLNKTNFENGLAGGVDSRLTDIGVSDQVGLTVRVNGTSLSPLASNAAVGTLDDQTVPQISLLHTYSSGAFTMTGYTIFRPFQTR